MISGQASEFKFESKFEPLLVIQLLLPKAIQDSKRQSKVMTAKSTAKLLGQRSGRAWAEWTGKNKHRVFLSQWQSLPAATGSI